MEIIFTVLFMCGADIEAIWVSITRRMHRQDVVIEQQGAINGY